ncbi:MAG: glycosyltransferase family 61 protein, partial [Mesorhizobium sp.]
RVASLYAEKRIQKGRRLLVKRLGTARAISNFDEVEAILHPRGFETVWLEGTSIEEQVLMFQSAEFVIGAHGAGLTNLLFCEPGTKVIEFMPTVEMRPFFWLMSEKLALRHGMQFCSSVEGEGFQASIRVDIDKLRELYDLVDGDRESNSRKV